MFNATDEYEVLTCDGFKDFAGIIKTPQQSTIVLTFDKCILRCTSNHQLQTITGEFIQVDKLEIGSIVIYETQVATLLVKDYGIVEDVFDLVEVADVHAYFTNGIHSHNCLMLDEIAFVKPEIQTAMWTSLAPTLSTGGQCIISSTPNGDQDLFAELYRGAMAGASTNPNNLGDNGFYGIAVEWDECPGRDAVYRENMIKKIGELAWRQEYVCEFLSSEPLLINSLVLNRLKTKLPLFSDFGFKFWQHISPKRTYLLGMDIAEGLGNDSSVIELFDAGSLEQVAEFRNNTITEPKLYDKLKEIIAYIYKKTDGAGNQASVLWSYENNACGKVISTLYYNDEDLAHPIAKAELISEGKKIGMNTSSATKSDACSLFKRLIEGNNTMTVHSEDLIKEMKIYVQRGNSGTYAAQPGGTDDLISACLIITRLVKHAASYDDAAFDRLYKGEVKSIADSDQVIDQEQENQEDAPMPYVF